MWLVPILALCLTATAVIDVAIAVLGLTRIQFFWPSAFCASLGGVSAVAMAIALLDFDASGFLYAALTLLGVSTLLSLFPAIRSMA